MKKFLNGEAHTMSAADPCGVKITNAEQYELSASVGPQTVPSFRTEAAVRSDVPAVTAFVETQLEKLGFSEENAILVIHIAIDEIYSNIVRHGYPEQPGPVTVSVYEGNGPHAVFIRFEDEGIPYDPLARDDPDITLSIEKRGYGGMGIFIVKKMMDGVEYKYENGKNILTIAKNF